MKRIAYLFLLVLSVFSLQGQNFWRPVSNAEVIRTRSLTQETIPVAFKSYTLDISAMKAYLEKAPVEFTQNEVIFPLLIPMPDGTMEEFRVFYSPVMESGLAARYPKIRSYKGVSMSDKNHNIRFDLGPFGFHAAISAGESIYIDPATEGDDINHFVYYTRDFIEDMSQFNLSCGLTTEDILHEDLHEHNHAENPENSDQTLGSRSIADDNIVTLRTYRLALACTGEWGKSKGNSIESALAVMVTAVNRLNQIYENDFAIRLLLINENDQLINLDAENDPYPIANVGYELLNINTMVINNKIGSNKYDIGHVFTRSCTDVGGVAYLSAACSGNKGGGVTCHYTDNLTYVVTQVWAHETGHQFSAQHTFNNCNGNESPGNAYEPGGGNTIMSYCGLCGSNNVSSTCVPNFHSTTVEQVLTFIQTGGGSTCGTEIITDNSLPVAELNYTNGFSIPISTPFILEGHGFDPDGDVLTYSWEQFNLGPQSTVGSPTDNSPSFATLEPTNMPYRVFPALSKIINNQYNNSEVLPTYSRDMNFRFIVRDNATGGGGVDWKNLSFKATADAGPFKIAYPQAFTTFTIGQEVEISWDVANTDRAPVNCSYVNIWLSDDAGYNYPYLLAYRVPNNGSKKVFMPNVKTNLGRIKIEAYNNIFFTISDNYVRLNEPTMPTATMDLEPIFEKVCIPATVNVNIETTSFNGFDQPLHFAVASGLPENAVAVFSPVTILPGEPTALQLILDKNVLLKETITLEIIAFSENGDTIRRYIDLDVTSIDFSDYETVFPVSGAKGMSQLIQFEWVKPAFADKFNFYLSTNPSFPAGSTIVASNITNNYYKPNETLQKSTVYYWKVEGINDCGTFPASAIQTFSTEVFSCNTYISEDVPLDIRSLQTTTATIDVPLESSIADVNILNIRGEHGRFYDLEASLSGPDGTKVSLFKSKCFAQNAVTFKLGFDDESPNKFACPPPQGSTFYPEGKMADFKGKSGAGQWKLEVYDKASPWGGVLREFIMEICANIVIGNPYLVVNEPYLVAIGIPWELSSYQLKAQDDDSAIEEITYTLLDLPAHADLLLRGNKLITGSTFLESELRNGDLQLMSFGEHGTEDSFSFVITDGKGGWLDKTIYNFTHDRYVQTENVLTDKQVRLFPNPTSDAFNVVILNEGPYQIELFDMNHRRIMQENIKGYTENKVDVNHLAPGMYLLRVSDSKSSAYHKLVKE